MIKKYVKKTCGEFWKEEDGIGVVEIILILVVLIALVLIFKDKITSIVDNAMNSIDKNSEDIIGE